MKTRSLIPVLALSLAVTLAVGCGKKSETNVTTIPTENPTPAVVTQKDGSPKASKKETAKPAAKTPGSFSADMVTSMPGGQVMNASMSVDGEMKSRVDMGNQIIIVRRDKGKMWMLDKATKTAMEMPVNEEMLKDVPKTHMDKSKMKHIGTEKVDGYMCDKYKMTVQAAGGDSTTWVSQDIGLPIKIESTTPQGNVSISFKNIKVGKQPASNFEIDPGYQISQMPQMPNVPR